MSPLSWQWVVGKLCAADIPGCKAQREDQCGHLCACVCQQVAQCRPGAAITQERMFRPVEKELQLFARRDISACLLLWTFILDDFVSYLLWIKDFIMPTGLNCPYKWAISALHGQGNIVECLQRNVAHLEKATLNYLLGWILVVILRGIKPKIIILFSMLII